MIIYPSESFASDQAPSEKKLNTYFEFQKQQGNVADSIFSEDGVQVFVSEEGDTQQYAYCVLPLIEYLCFEIFKAGNNAFNLKMLITHWKEYVQAARSHTSLFAEHCHWRKFAMQMTQEQQDLYRDLESLLLNDELRELDDIIRVCCGAEVNKDSKKISELQIASKLAHSASELKNKEAKLQEYKNCEIEKSALEVKCEKLTADVQTNESIATKNHTLLQTSRKEAEQLSEELNKLIQKTNTELTSKNEEIGRLKDNVNQLNQHLIALKEETATLQNANLKQAEELEALLSAKQASETQQSELKNQKLELENKLATAMKEKDSHINTLKEEADLTHLQILQLQEELEALFNAKQEREKQLEDQLESKLEEQNRLFENKLVKAIEEKDNHIHTLKEEADLTHLQVSQLQEELEALFTTKQNYEAQINSLKAQLENTNSTDNSSLENMQAENELMQLQILQLQEELEFYFEKANTKSQEETSLPITNEEKSIDSVANTLLENHNTLGLITRLVTAQGRE